MDELERRLRAAMTAAAEPAPFGLMDAIRRRHKRHRKRVTAGSVAAVAALGLAVVPIVQQSARPGRSGAPANSFPAVRPGPAVAPGTARFTCVNAAGNGSWQAHGLRVGPLWLVSLTDQNPRVQALDIEIADGATVTLKVSASSRSYAQFLGSLYPGGADPLPSGDTGVSFTSCSAPIDQFTEFGVGFSLPAGRSAIVDVWTPGARHPTQVVFTCTRRGCHL